MHASAPQRSSSGLDGVCVSVEELARLGAASRGISFRARQPAQSILGGRHASRLRGPGLDFEELRAYQAGDDIRAMDWRVTVRMRAAYVRIYRDEKERPVIVVVDQRAGMFFGSVRDMKSVTAARASAVVAQRVVSGGDKIGAVVFGDDELMIFRPQRSQRHVMRIVGCIVEFNRKLATGSKKPDLAALDTAHNQVVRMASHDHLIVLVSDLSGAGLETKKLVTELRRKNDVVLLWVHDPLEARLPDVGEAVLGDGVWQVQVDTTNPAVRERFAADVAARAERASALAAHYDVPFLSLTTEQDVVAQLRAQLERYRARPRT